jgi:uncharacterized membrane protein
MTGDSIAILAQKTSSGRSRFGIWYLVLVVPLAAYALRLYRLDDQSIWWDEGHSIQMASATLGQIPTLPGMDVHPPGYFSLLHQWMSSAGRSEFALRYLSVVFSLLTVALLIRFGRALADHSVGWPGRPTAIVVGSLAAVSPLYVAYAQEVRMYAIVTFFGLASMYSQWQVVQGWKTEPRAGQSPSLQSTTRYPIWYLIGYILATTASLYTHYFTAFLILFQNLVWLLWALMARSSRGLRLRHILVWFSSQLAILILFSPQLPLTLQQTVAYANPNLNPPGVGEFISRSWLTYTVGLAAGPAVGGWIGWGVAVALGFTVLFRIVKARPGARGDYLVTVAFLAGWFLIPLAAYFLILQSRPSFEPRYMMLVTPALMLLLAWGLVGNGRRWVGWPWGLVTGLVLAAFAAGTWFYFTNVEAYKDDSAGVAAWLAAETTSDDVVYVDVPHPFHYYAERIPAPTRYLFVDVHTAADILNAEVAGRRRFFWVTWRGSDTDPRQVIPFLLDKTGHRVQELDFRGYHVTGWQLQDDAQFSLPTDLGPIDITFGDVVRLDRLAFSDTVYAGEIVWATLHFTLLRDTPVDYRVSLRLRNSAGEMLASTDKDLLNDRHFRTSAWPLRDSRLNQAINVYILPISTDILPGKYCLEAVVYEATTLEALPVANMSVSECISPAGDGISALLGVAAVLP